MADESKWSSGNLSLTGEYFFAMEAISTHLMRRLPNDPELWQLLGQVEMLLTEAQMTETPTTALFGKGGVAGFCQTIIDEKTHGQHDTSTIPRPPKNEPRRERNTRNTRIRRKKNLLTAIIITVWCIAVVGLIGQYIGFWPYLWGDCTYYLEELYNFTPTGTPLESSSAEVTLPLRLHSISGMILYEVGNHRVYISDIGYDDDALSSEKGGLRRWWVELSYTKDIGYTHISYIEPPETGKAEVTLSDGSVHSQDLYFQGEHHDPSGTSCIRLYFLELPKDTDFKGGSAHITFDSMTQVHWTRTGVGSQAK